MWQLIAHVTLQFHLVPIIAGRYSFFSGQQCISLQLGFSDAQAAAAAAAAADSDVNKDDDDDDDDDAESGKMQSIVVAYNESIKFTLRQAVLKDCPRRRGDLSRIQFVGVGFENFKFVGKLRQWLCAVRTNTHYNSAQDCSISIKFTTEYDHMTPDLPQTFKINGSKLKVIA